MNNKDKNSVVSIHLMFDGSEYTRTKVQAWQTCRALSWFRFKECLLKN